LIDGRTITVEAGIITAVAEDAPAAEPEAKEDDDEMQTLKDKITDLEAQLSNSTAKEEEMTNKVKTYEVQIPEMVKAIAELKKVAVGGEFKAVKAVTQPANKSTKEEPKAKSDLSAWGNSILKSQGLI
jgi:predicted  nucleic acid-binding Zn-ribbon protein